MAARALPAPARTTTENLRAWFKSEFSDGEKIQAHLNLLKAASIFGGAIFVMRTFGDAFAA